MYNSPEASPALAAQHEARRPLDPATDAEAATQLQRRLCASPLAAAPSAVDVSDSDTDDDEPLISCIKPGHVTLLSSAQSPAGSSATSSEGDVEVLAEWETPPGASLPAGAVVTSPKSCSAAAGRQSSSLDLSTPQVCSLTCSALPAAENTCFPRRESCAACWAWHSWPSALLQALHPLQNGVHATLGHIAVHLQYLAACCYCEPMSWHVFVQQSLLAPWWRAQHSSMPTLLVGGPPGVHSTAASEG